MARKPSKKSSKPPKAPQPRAERRTPPTPRKPRKVVDPRDLSERVFDQADRTSQEAEGLPTAPLEGEQSADPIQVVETVVPSATTTSTGTDSMDHRLEEWAQREGLEIVDGGKEPAPRPLMDKLRAQLNKNGEAPKPAPVPVFDGQHCPKCGSQVKKSGTTGRLYCPKQYAKFGTPCSWPGTTELPEIPACTTLSVENQAILDVAGANIRNSLLIRARAGTGKSFQLKQLVRSWTHPPVTSPKRVLILAFARRDQAALSGGVRGHADVRTGNSAAYWTLATYYRQAGGGGDLKTEEGWLGEVLESMLREEGLIPPPGERGQRQLGRDTQSAIQIAVDKARSTLPLSAAPLPGENTFPAPTDEMWITLADDWDLELGTGEQKLFLTYCARLFEEMASLKNLLAWGKTDFTGQVFLTVYHGLRTPKVYDIVCIDEEQDAGRYIRRLAFAFVAPQGHLVAVGDDMQTIYTWRTGEVDGLAAIADEMARRGGQFPDERPLTVCRRCAKAVLRDAQHLVPDIQPLPEAPEGFSVHVPDGSRLVGMLKQGWEAKGEAVPGRQGLVICRMNGPLVGLCLALWREGVPAVLAKGDLGPQLVALVDKLSGGKEQCKLVDFLEYLRTWETDSLRKLGVGVVPDEGMGAATRTISTEQSGEEPPPPTKEEINKKRKANTISDKAECLRAIASKEGTRVVADVKRTLSQLFPPRGEEPDASRTVVLSTVHGAKGGEARYVYLLSPPSRTRGEEEPVSIFDLVWSSPRDTLCTLYVAITRAEYGLCYVGPKPRLEQLSGGYEIGNEEEE